MEIDGSPVHSPRVPTNYCYKFCHKAPSGRERTCAFHANVARRRENLCAVGRPLDARHVTATVPCGTAARRRGSCRGDGRPARLLSAGHQARHDPSLSPAERSTGECGQGRTARAARAATGFRERNPRRARILNSQFKNSAGVLILSFSNELHSEHHRRDHRWAQDAQNHRRQRRWGDAIRPGDSFDGTPRSREDCLFPPSCGSGRPHAGAGAGASATIPQCQ